MTDEFEQLLAETGITFVPPAGFEPFPLRDCKFRYHRAFRNAGGIEVRFRIDSLQRLRAQMNGFLPPNFSETAFVSGITNLSGGKARVRQEDAELAREFFNADWVKVAYFTPADPQFAPDHESAVVYYFHRKDIADIYLIGLHRKGDEEHHMLGTEPPVRYPDFTPAPAAKPAAASNEEPAHSEAFVKVWRQAMAIIDGSINLDGRPLPEPNAAEKRGLRDAISLFEQAAELEPGNPGPMLLVSKIHERLAHPPHRLEAIRKAHAICPDNLTIIVELGAALSICGKNDEAISVLRMGTRIHPSDPRLYFNLGVALLLSEDAAGAVPVFERLVALEPQGAQNKRLLDAARDIAAGKRPAPRTEGEVKALL